MFSCHATGKMQSHVHFMPPGKEKFQAAQRFIWPSGEKKASEPHVSSSLAQGSSPMVNTKRGIFKKLLFLSSSLYGILFLFWGEGIRKYKTCYWKPQAKHLKSPCAIVSQSQIIWKMRQFLHYWIARVKLLIFLQSSFRLFLILERAKLQDPTPAVWKGRERKTCHVQEADQRQVCRLPGAREEMSLYLQLIRNQEPTLRLGRC